MISTKPSDTPGAPLPPQVLRAQKPGTEPQQAQSTSETDPEFFIRKTFEADAQKGCELLFRLYYRAMCTHAVRFVYSREVAEDLVSDLFYTFWNTQAYLGVHTSYRAYLFRSVRNRAYNYLANDLKKADPLEFAHQQEGSLTDSPEQMMGLEELYHKIDELVATLPPQCRKVFLMNRFEGRKCKDIALELQLSPRTVETHVQKALNVLKLGLKDQWLWLLLILFSL
ncbi:hypothetical protein GCM10027275_47300 [Rhabdobacter roseus]|uniref:RNA polymerase sigma-70 factor (ECF subfamily) n=1 Tax=Rhabdobacter roseus TaxID=1655419 RepID=A0A840TR76_9BACT|nr:RNA polymerase sigma-70 factor [Rhabdobacter roseus]MBB5286391.1 RNA polymerase sigma-70 factor (ECF subfamily) [Rhabdobacter roseus]